MRLTVAPLSDLVTDPTDGTSVVMVGQRVIALSPMATAILFASAARAVTLEELAMHLENRFGTPPQRLGSAHDLAEAMVCGLIDEGVLQVDPSGM